MDRQSSEVQAVAVCFPLTDLLNYGGEHATVHEHFVNYMTETTGRGFDAPFDFRRWNEKKHRDEPVADPEQRKDYFRQNSPVTHVSARTPPTLVLHGARDRIVPLQQSELFASRLKESGVPHKLIVFPDLAHELPPPEEERHAEVLSWFGRHLG